MNFFLTAMDLSDYTTKDFVLNESFQKWILEADVEAKAFWEVWLNDHPHKMELIADATSTIQFLRMVHENKLKRAGDQVWGMISESIHNLDSDTTLKEIKEIEKYPMRTSDL